jgi:mRNA interferase RelE/StbE
LAWKVEFTASAARQLKKLDRNLQKRVLAYLRALVSECDDPRQRGKGLTGGLSGHWRYRVGDHRILCRIEQGQLVVVVLQLGHRSEIYER